jgi:phosphomannomutase
MTPTVGVVADRDDAAGGLVVTASHNPQEWNGLKCLVREQTGPEVVSACAPRPAIAEEIIARFRALPEDAPPGPCSPVPPAGGAEVQLGKHLGPVLGAIGEWPSPGPVRRRRFRVVLDSVNGAGRFGGRELLASALGCELIHRGADDSGVFPHAPEPTKENLSSLSAAMRKFAADIGFAQDPDGDRLAIVDENGVYVGEEYTLALAAEGALAARVAAPSGRRAGGGPVLVANLSTSRMIDDVAARHGARVIRTPVGEAHVAEAMKREAAAGRDVPLGGEGNGGVIWPRVTYVRDSLSAMALVLTLMARTGKKISELVASIPAYCIEKRKVDLARREDAAGVVEAVAAHFRAGRVDGGPASSDLQDGVRVDWPGRKAWLHVRASNTEPVLRLIAEAPTGAEARAVLDEAARVTGR